MGIGCRVLLGHYVGGRGSCDRRRFDSGGAAYCGRPYLLDSRQWGKGYATEAARAIVEWAFSVPVIRRVWATCDTQNVASARVLEKAGLQLEGTLRRAIVRPNLGNEPRDAFIYARVR